MHKNLVSGFSLVRHIRPLMYAFVFVLSIGALPKASVFDVKPTRAVNDFSRVLPVSTVQSIEALAAALQRRTGFALAIVTVDDLDGLEIEDFAVQLYKKWGIGSREKDEGALVVLAPVQRVVRIEVGYGAEGYITDIESSGIIQSVMPRLRQQAWGDALIGIAAACAELVAREHGTTLQEIAADLKIGRSLPAREPQGSDLLNGVFLILAILFFVGTPMGRRMLPWLLLFALSSGVRSRRSSGGFGGGFGGGGFGGFGGGMSGGGGATGRF